jgi:hypothetical protein
LASTNYTKAFYGTSFYWQKRVTSLHPVFTSLTDMIKKLSCDVYITTLHIHGYSNTWRFINIKQANIRTIHEHMVLFHRRQHQRKRASWFSFFSFILGVILIRFFLIELHFRCRLDWVYKLNWKCVYCSF